MRFEPAVIESFAQRLYRRASLLALKYWLLYTLLGGVCSTALYYYLPARTAHDMGTFVSLAMLVIFGVIGLSVGHEKAFALRLQAQTALCQVQIERNTRAAMDLASRSIQDPMSSAAAVHLAPPDHLAGASG